MKIPKRHMTASVCIAIVLIVAAAPALAQIKTENINFKAGRVDSHSYLVYDDAQSGRRPGVLVIPEWWGLNDYPKMRAKMLARLGFLALAVDVYGDGKVTSNPNQAGAWSGALENGDRIELRKRLSDALERLKRDPRVDPERIAAIGYCFGGLSVLELARSGASLDGVVSFHGPLETSSPASAGLVKARVLVCTGADDPYVPAAKVIAFENEMRGAQANFEINIYSGAKHSFTNPEADHWHSPDLGYNREADHRSWQAMRDFYAEIFKNK